MFPRITAASDVKKFLERLTKSFRHLKPRSRFPTWPNFALLRTELAAMAAIKEIDSESDDEPCKETQPRKNRQTSHQK